MHVLQLEHVPQQPLGGDTGQRAHLQGLAMQTAGDDLDEPPEQDAHQVWREWICDRLAATNEHVGQQRQPQRVAMGQPDQLIVTDRVDATGAQVRAAVARAQVAKRHDPQQLPPRRVGPPRRTRC